MKISQLHFLTILIAFISCSGANNESNTKETTAPEFENKAHELVYDFHQKVGTLSQLREKKDVVYKYSYKTADGREDVSIEKYLFDGELSYAKYVKHERSFPDLEGDIEQAYDGKGYWFKHNGALVQDSAILERVKFTRHTNYYWFAMFQKLLDPGVQYNYIGNDTIDAKIYDIVKIGFDAPEGVAKDIYQLYINKETGLVDQFLFTVADYGVLETPFLMELKYEDVDGILIPSKRRYKKSNWHAELEDGPWVDVNWFDIRFNNGLARGEFSI